MCVCVCLFRYSLPVNFQGVVMKPHRKAQKKVTDTLTQMYTHLDSKFIASELAGASCPGDRYREDNSCLHCH